MVVLFCSAVALMELLVQKSCEWWCGKLDCNENSWMLQQEVRIETLCQLQEPASARTTLLPCQLLLVGSAGEYPHHFCFLCQSAWCLQSAHFHWWSKDYQWKWLLKEDLLPYQKQAGYRCIVPATSDPLSVMKAVPVLCTPFPFLVLLFAEQTFCHISPPSQCWLQ